MSLFHAGITLKARKMKNILAEIKVNYQSKVKFSEMPFISSSKDAEKLLRSMWSDSMEFKEEFYILILNRANRVKGYYKVSEGGTAGTVVDPKIVFSVALKCQASGIILAHNHPSGNSQPSESDRQLTKKIKEGGKLLEIQILDHIIITAESYYSFADEEDM
ncbi:JAB domain-containing protein [soil metagenome]